ncbi:MAG: phage terminase large subunit, partial [Oscillospiraceae bacterium]
MKNKKKEQSIGRLFSALNESKEEISNYDKDNLKDLNNLLKDYLYRACDDIHLLLQREFESGVALVGEDGLRKKLGALDLEFFGRAYLPHYFTKPSPEFHHELDRHWTQGVMKEIIPFTRAQAEMINTKQGCKRATAAPRGHAKSTNFTFKDSLHATVYRYKHYIVLLSDSSDQAEGFLDSISTELLENEAIIQDFGKLEGKVWRSNVVVTKTNIKIEAIGSGKKIRGRKHKNWRPDLIILDDIENDENVRTSEQRNKLENWFYKAVSKAGDGYTDIVYIGTLLHYDSLLAKILRNPGYKSAKYKAVLSFSNDLEHWKKWEELYTDLSDEAHEETARLYFENNKATMLDGTSVLWNEKLSYYDLMVMKVTEGDAAFNSEEQNEPINPEDCLFREEWLEYYNEAEITFQGGDWQYFGFCDPSLGKTKNSDYSAIITLAKQKSSGYLYVLDADVERCHPDKIITDILDKERMLRKTFGHGYTKFGCETVQFQWFLKEELAKASAKAGLYLPVEEVPQSTDKTLRIQTLQPDIKNHYIKFNKRHKLLLEQLLFFPMAGYDDAPDALEGCRTIAKKSKRF